MTTGKINSHAVYYTIKNCQDNVNDENKMRKIDKWHLPCVTRQVRNPIPPTTHIAHSRCNFHQAATFRFIPRSRVKRAKITQQPNGI